MIRKAKRRLVYVGSGSLAAITIGALTLWYVRDADSVVRPFRTGLYEPGGDVLLRFLQPGGDELLMCYLTPQESMNRSYAVNDGVSASSRVFRYSMSSKDVAPVTVMEWQRATGEITECGDQRMLANSAWRVNTSRHSLTFNKNRVTTAGRTVLKMVIAPSGDRLAVLSADGDYKDATGLFFLGSAPTATGRRFHEVFRADTTERIGAAVRLANAGEDIVTVPCWSPDGRIVVYCEGSHEKFWFIEAELGTVRRP